MTEHKHTLIRNGIIVAAIIGVIVGGFFVATNIANNYLGTTFSSLSQTSSSVTSTGTSQFSISTQTATTNSASSTQSKNTTSPSLSTLTTSSTTPPGQIVATLSLGNHSAISSFVYDSNSQYLIMPVGTDPPSNADYVTILNTQNQQVVRNSTALSANLLTFDSRDNLIFGGVSNGGSQNGYVNAYNATSLQLVKSILVGIEPAQLFYDSDNGRVYVPVQGFTGQPTTTPYDLQVIDAKTLTVIQNITVGYSPEYLAYNSQLKYLYVADEGTTMFTNGNSVSNQSIVVINTVNNNIVTVIKNDSDYLFGSLSYSPASNELYAQKIIYSMGPTDQLLEINGTTNTIVETITLPFSGAVGSMQYNPSNGELLIAAFNMSSLNSTRYSVAILDTHTRTLTEQFSMPDGATILAMCYANGYLYVSSVVPPYQRFAENGMLYVFSA